MGYSRGDEKIIGVFVHKGSHIYMAFSWQRQQQKKLAVPKNDESAFLRPQAVACESSSSQRARIANTRRATDQLFQFTTVRCSGF